MRTILLILLVLGASMPARGQDGLSSARALYASAQYEEALKAFDSLRSSGAQAPVLVAIEQGRAFCLLALDRRAEADAVLERLVRLDPFLKLSDEDAPPKIRSAFRDVRRRLLAGLMQEAYQAAKAAYERKAFDEAAAGFAHALALLEDEDLGVEGGARDDMRLVARAFGELSKAASRPAPPTPLPGSDTGGAPEPPATSAVSPATAGNRAGPAANLPYDASSEGVTPPVVERSQLVLPDSLRRALGGSDVVVEVVVAADGTVESAVSRRSPDSMLGALVARAVSDWRYRPATRGGIPVRYRLIARVVVAK